MQWGRPPPDAMVSTCAVDTGWVSMGSLGWIGRAGEGIWHLTSTRTEGKDSCWGVGAAAGVPNPPPAFLCLSLFSVH